MAHLRSMNELADELSAEMDSTLPDTDEQRRQQLVDYLKSLLVESPTNHFYHVHTKPEYRPSIEKLIELYESHQVDIGTVVYVCKGQQVDIQDGVEAPEFTIECGRMETKLHQRMVLPRMAADKLHRVNVKMSLIGLADRAINRPVIFDTGSTMQSIDTPAFLTLTDPANYQPGTILPD